MASDPERALSRLAARIRRCVQCPLHEGRANAVPGEGDPRARTMLIGEAPGAAEDEEGRPFCGPSGRHLDKVLAQVGLERAEMFLTSCVKCRPPSNRTPHRQELRTCRQLYLDRQMALVDPDVVVLLGKVAVELLLGETDILATAHGYVERRHGRRFLSTYHPAAAMRFPGPAAGMRQDFRKLKRLLSQGD